MVMVCHVDDYIIGCSDPKWFPKFLKTFNEHFPMNLVGEPQQYLGMKIEWDEKNETVSFSQTKRINEMIDKFKLIDAQKTYLTPMENKFSRLKS